MRAEVWLFILFALMVAAAMGVIGAELNIIINGVPCK